jgi:HD-like signal output (HDOD) protein/ActR/RegA family two-component response regulator
MGKKNVIFVDDEQNILEGLRRMLRSLRNEYNMHFATGGAEALKLMADECFDVVVSDMRMPGMDGAELLEIIQEKYPHTIRIMLTGQADEQSILRTVGVVHQFLAKPCDPESLKTILIQVGALQDMFTDGGLKDLVSQLGKLPSLPSTYSRLQKAIATPDIGINEIAEIIAQDIAMTAKVLQLVNSSFFGIYSSVDSPSRAVTLLGLDTIKVLVLSLELFSKIKVQEQVFHIDRLWDHSLMVGKVARAIAATQTDEKELISNTFLAGTLHDLGKLILLSSKPDEYRQVIDLAQERNIIMPEAEQVVFGATQSAVGSYLTGLWGFAPPIIEAIGFQSCIEKYPITVFTPVLAVHVANVLYYRNRPEEIIGRPLDLNMPVIERLDLKGELVEWEKICADILQPEE